MVVIDVLVIRKKQTAKIRNSEIQTPVIFNRRSLNIPEGMYFSKGHTWIKSHGKNSVKAGIDDFVIKALGKIKITDLAGEGTKVKKGDVIMEGIFESKPIKFRSPIDGEILTVNSSLLNQNVNNPYDSDWGVVIKNENLNDSLQALLSDLKATQWMKKEVRRLKDFLSFNTLAPELAGVTMYDGGNIVEGAVSMLNATSIDEFQEEFLAV